ncbi:MAG: hypothetical protein Lokiarch_13220 [Candidatus Lokiarchaeum sp. GC14_75]|nr:MAG: hypothetical protein Lokiarch_13220 [Candidatus Lokiarchaeum sp. GC14_75]
MRERYCFRCGKALDFESFIKNAGPNDTEDSTTLWNSEHIEFFCCHCYSFKIKYQPTLDVDEFQYY